MGSQAIIKFACVIWVRYVLATTQSLREHWYARRFSGGDPGRGHLVYAGDASHVVTDKIGSGLFRF